MRWWFCTLNAFENHKIQDIGTSVNLCVVTCERDKSNDARDNWGMSHIVVVEPQIVFVVPNGLEYSQNYNNYNQRAL